MLDLTPYSKFAEPYHSGITKKFRFSFDNKSYFFKENPKKTINNKKTEFRSDFYEVLASYILEKTGCKNFVKYDFATFQGKNGTISESFLREDEEEITLAKIMQFLYANEKSGGVLPLNTQLDSGLLLECYKKYLENGYSLAGVVWTIADILNSVEEFAKTYDLSFDRAEFSRNLSEIAVYDYFLGNTDRTWHNIAFVYSAKEKNISVAPIFDNASCFDSYISAIDDKNVDEIYALMGFSGLKDEDYNNLLKNGGALVVDFLNEAKNNERVNNLIEILKNLDIKSTISAFENDKNVKIDSKDSENIIQSFEYRVSTFNQKSNKLTQKLNNEIALNK